MKKALFIALVTVFAASPVWADGHHRKKPGCKHEECCVKKACKNTCKVLHFVVKLPFRLVASTAAGVYGVLSDFDFDGFKDGYNVI
jgi:hypothetical protein